MTETKVPNMQADVFGPPPFIFSNPSAGLPTFESPMSGKYHSHRDGKGSRKHPMTAKQRARRKK